MKRYGALALVLAASTLTGLSGCDAPRKVKTTLNLNDLHIRAAIAEDEGNWEEAYNLWTQYLETRPQGPLANYRVGLVEMRLGLYQQAISHLRIAHDLEPGNIEYLEALASALVTVGDQDALMTLLRQTAEEGPDGSGYLRMGRYAQDAGLLDEAHEAFSLAIVAARGESPEPYLAMAKFGSAIGDQDLEIRNLRYALWFDLDNASISSRLTELGMIPGPSLALAPEF